MAKRITAFLLGSVFMFACTLDAQERFGGLTGTVTDASDAAVPGATVTATNKETSATRVAVSGGDGAYKVPDLEPGRYSVTIELQGFQTVALDDVIVLLGKTVSLDAQLRPGALSEIVKVTADATRQLDLTSVTLAHNVTSEELDRLPKSRSYQGIALVTPATGITTRDVVFLPDRGEGLNASVATAARTLAECGASELVVLHADLPLLVSH